MVGGGGLGDAKARSAPSLVRAWRTASSISQNPSVHSNHLGELGADAFPINRRHDSTNQACLSAVNLAILSSMRTWTLEKAKNGFSEVVRLALDHEPQLVTRGRSGAEAVVVVSREDYERLIAPTDLYTAMQQSPLGKAVAEGLFDGLDPFPRRAEYSREPEFGGPDIVSGLLDDEADATGLP